MRMICVAMVLVAGCNSSYSEQRSQQDADHRGRHQHIPGTVYDLDVRPAGWMPGHLIDTTLPDGTRCIVHYEGGIACDFGSDRRGS